MLLEFVSSREAFRTAEAPASLLLRFSALRAVITTSKAFINPMAYPVSAMPLPDQYAFILATGLPCTHSQ